MEGRILCLHSISIGSRTLVRLIHVHRYE